MIIDLPDTTVSQVAKQLVKVREEGGAVALGRDDDLLAVADPEGQDAEDAGGVDALALRAGQGDRGAGLARGLAEERGGTGVQADARADGDGAFWHGCSPWGT